MKQPSLNLPVQPANSIANVVDMEKELSLAVNIDEVMEVDLNVLSISERKGVNGDYIVMDIQLLSTGEEFKVATGAVIIVNIMRKIDAQKQFPVSCQFYSPKGTRAKLVRAIANGND